MNTPSYFAIDNLHINKNNLGVIENNLPSISVYPNPMTNELVIKGESGLIEMFDLSGKIVLTSNYSGYSVLDVSEFSLGSYTLKITNENGTMIQKVIK